RRVADDGHGRAEAAEERGRDAVRGTVRAVQRDPHAGEIEVREALVQRAQVVLLRAVQRADPADRRAAVGGLGRAEALLQAALDLELGRVGQLEAVPAE